MKYDLCVFDLDGTLVDTIADISAAVNAALAQLGYPEKSESEIATIVGHSAVYMCQHALPPEHMDKWQILLQEYTRYYRQNCCNLSRPYEGILPVLNALRLAGVKMSVVSNKPHAQAVKVLTTLFPKDCFSLILGQMDKFRVKPDPMSLCFVLDYLGIPSERAVYVGDSDVDVVFANNAGVDCIAVSWGLRSRQVLESAGAPCIIDDAGELVEKVLHE